MGQPDTPEQEQSEAEPDKPTTAEPRPTDAERGTPSAAAPTSSNPRRSNEFWLALAGIAATLVVGVTGAVLTYNATLKQIQAQSQGQAVEFSKNERKDAYAEYLVAYTELYTIEFQFVDVVARERSADVQQIDGLYAAFTDATDKTLAVDETVRLVASREVTDAHYANVDHHNKLKERIEDVTAAARAGTLSTMGAKLDELSKLIDLHNEYILDFIDAAQHDLGLS